ncbi:hypothetical protein EHS25_009401 [Saitozyma podzolica]|uniref:GST N-terminal domain-containing protein n=1 Tax=Saitozyma podzolica TaxID=1890683 RepID=A0A427YLU0_9TREE|nr:hypothetical protein EHS25_009401 [Saitozyma podzolica]
MPGPDENVHPEATGEAKKLVDAHQDAQDLVFYSGWFCPFNQRVWMALEERKIPYQYREVNPYKKEAAFLKLNPLGLVPTIEVGQGSGKGLYESDVLVEFLEDLVPPSDDHPSIYPSGTYEKSWARLNVQHITKKIIPVSPPTGTHTYLVLPCLHAASDGRKTDIAPRRAQHYFSLQMRQDASGQASAREDLYTGLRTLLECKASGGPYFFGKQWTVVDMSLAPFVRRFYNLEKFRAFKDSEVGNGWEEYKAALLSRESLKATSSLDEYYTELLARYLNNTATSEVAKATRGGHHLP